MNYKLNDNEFLSDIKGFIDRNYLKNRTALGRFGTMDELTSIIVFLSSDKASFFHGSIIQPDGGQSRQYMAFNYLA